MAVSKRLRYEILKRDNHACRYCGAAAPDAPLTIDHVVPVTLGGTDTPDNLVAACRDCNAGKSSVPPGADLVEDVGADAIRWKRAMEKAAAVLDAEEEKMRPWMMAFVDEWDRYKVKRNGMLNQMVPLPANYSESLERLYRAGLRPKDLVDSIRVAMRKAYADDRFAYFCGVAWNKLSEQQEIARKLLAADED